MKYIYIIGVFVLSVTLFSIGLNEGYKVGLKRCRADRLLEGLPLNKIECHYKK